MNDISPYGLLQDVVTVDSVIIRNNAESCGLVTGEKVYVDFEMLCKKGVIYEDCEVRITISGDINYDSGEFHISEGDRQKKTVMFTMPSHDVSFDIVVKECDFATADDIAYNQNHQIPNVTQEEKDACNPIIPPIDFSKIDLNSIFIGAAAGGALGLAFEGKQGAIQFGLLGGVGALAYSYLTTTQ